MARGSYVSADDVDAELFGEPRRETISYLRERVERYAPRIREVFNGFFEDTHEMFERYNGDRALRRIRARIRKSSDYLIHDTILPLRTMDQMQKAKPIMQRYLMANPTARRYEREQRFDGYSDSYCNTHSHRPLFDDPDYMRVIDGVVFDEDRFGVDVSSDSLNRTKSYQNAFDTDERGLDLIEQSDVMTSWDYLEMMLEANGKDPTSILNESL